MSFISFTLQNNSPADCRICLESVDPTSCLVSHEGGGDLHPVHRDCIKKIIEYDFERAIQPKCPLCQRGIVKLDNVPIEELDVPQEPARSRIKAISKMIIRIRRTANIHLSVINMMENTLGRTEYLVTDQYGKMGGISCRPVPSVTFGQCAYEISLRRIFL
jgi:hypothetical protein